MNKDKIYDIVRLLTCLVFFFSIGSLTNLIFKVFNFDKNNMNVFDNVLYSFVVSLFLFILLFFMYKDTIKKDFYIFRNNKKTYINYTVKMFIIFIIVKYFVGIICSLIMNFMGIDSTYMVSNNQNLIEQYVKNAPILMFISVSILGPFYEECIFRLGFRKVIDNKFAYIIISGTLFGILHVFPLNEGVTLPIGLIQSVSYVVMGCFFSYIYYKNNNIFISIILHFLNNFISVLLMLKMLF